MEQNNLVNEERKFYFWLKTLLFSMVVVFIVLMLGYLIFVGGPVSYHISNKNSDWSSFAAVISGAAAPLSAFGTLIVIVISSRQFKMQQQQIDSQEKRWKIELEIINFDKYQKHKKDFNNHLENYENDSKNIICKSKLSLYENVFPKNCFSYSSYTIENIDNIDIIKEFNRLCTVFKNKSYNLEFSLTLYQIFLSKHKLQIFLENKIGDVKNGTIGPISIISRFSKIREYLLKIIEFGCEKDCDHLLNHIDAEDLTYIIPCFISEISKDKILIKQKNKTYTKDILYCAYIIINYGLAPKYLNDDKRSNSIFLSTLENLDKMSNVNEIYEILKSALKKDEFQFENEEKIKLESTLKRIELEIRHGCIPE